jgi:hypothetical protein
MYSRELLSSRDIEKDRTKYFWWFIDSEILLRVNTTSFSLLLYFVFSNIKGSEPFLRKMRLPLNILLPQNLTGHFLLRFVSFPYCLQNFSISYYIQLENWECHLSHAIPKIVPEWWKFGDTIFNRFCYVYVHVKIEHPFDQIFRLYNAHAL